MAATVTATTTTATTATTDHGPRRADHTGAGHIKRWILGRPRRCAQRHATVADRLRGAEPSQHRIGYVTDRVAASCEAFPDRAYRFCQAQWASPYTDVTASAPAAGLSRSPARLSYAQTPGEGNPFSGRPAERDRSAGLCVTLGLRTGLLVGGTASENVE